MHDTKTGVDRAWPAYLMRRGPFCRTYPKLGGKFDSAPKKSSPTDEMKITFSAHYSTTTLTINKERRIKISCSDTIFQNNIHVYLKIITKHFFHVRFTCTFILLIVYSIKQDIIKKIASDELADIGPTSSKPKIYIQNELT